VISLVVKFSKSLSEMLSPIVRQRLARDRAPQQIQVSFITTV